MQLALSLTVTTLCPVKPMDEVVFTPLDTEHLKEVVRGRVMNTLNTSGGNWRCAVVLEGEPFPTGRSVNVYSHEGTFKVLPTTSPTAEVSRNG